MGTFDTHRDGDCWPDTCAVCAEEKSHEDSHDLTTERECRRCGMTDHDNEVTERYCVSADLTVVARPGLECETVYVNPDGSAFWTPDGVGCYFFIDAEAAFAEAGNPDDWETVHLDREFAQ